MHLPADAPHRQTPCSSSHPSNSSSRSSARSTAAGFRSRHSRPPANPTSSRRLPSHDSGAALSRRVHARAAATLPAKPPTASCPRSALSRALPKLSRRSSSHCCAQDSHPHARCLQSVLHRATTQALSLPCKSLPARPPNSLPAGIAERSAAVQTRCAPASHTPHRSASGSPAMTSTDRRPLLGVRTPASHPSPQVLAEPSSATTAYPPPAARSTTRTTRRKSGYKTKTGPRSAS